MNRVELFEQIQKKRSFLCIGLDSDINKLPESIKSLDDPIFEFNKAIIDATHPYCVSYKPNIAFYEALGSKGWESLEKTIQYIKTIDSNLFVIADAKRGDIGNTSSLYARAFFESMNSDAITVAPYMGSDSVKPFLNYDGKWVILLALTSNEGAYDFQFLESENNPLYKHVIRKSFEWANQDQIMFVVGATKAESLTEIRSLAPHSFLLVPGVGAQGGSLSEVAKFGMNKECGLLVNASRSIIFASSGADFALEAKAEAIRMQKEMDELLTKYL